MFVPVGCWPEIFNEAEIIITENRLLKACDSTIFSSLFLVKQELVIRKKYGEKCAPCFKERDAYDSYIFEEQENELTGQCNNIVDCLRPNGTSHQPLKIILEQSRVFAFWHIQPQRRQ